MTNDEQFEHRLFNDEAKHATFTQKVEAGRDLYESMHGRRVPLVTQHDLAFFASQEELGQTRTLADVPFDEFIGAVYFFASDGSVDHEHFESMPYFGGYGMDEELCLRTYTLRYLEAKEDFEEKQALPVHPNCSARKHVLAKFFSVYDHAVSVTRGVSNGVCWLATRVLADNIAGLQRRQASAAIKWLVANGWLEELSAPTNKKGGQYRVVEHDEWVEQHGDGQCMRDKRPSKT
jgi:hypothetical protein